MNTGSFKILPIMYVISLLLIGCRQIGAPGTMESPTHPPTGTTMMTETQTIPAVPTPWDDMPKDPPISPPTNLGLPELIERAKADLAQRLSIQVTQINAIKTESVVWPDTSLGCPQPGVVYAQVPTAGYFIVLTYAESRFEYHVDMRGNTLYCENPTPPIAGTPADLNPLPTAPP
jgi:hypothetical protein